MKANFVKPNFKGSIVNISATFAEFLGCPNDKPTLPILANELSKNYKNIVFLILDGLGLHPLCTNLDENSFLRRNVRQTLTSVFPSTTTNATTSLLSNLYPMEHGWFGWSLYFEELGRAVNIFPAVDTFTGENVGESFIKQRLPAKPFYKLSKIYRPSAIVPDFWHGDEDERIVYRTLDEMFSLIEACCAEKEKRFLYGYSAEPDSTMHRYGVSSAQAAEIIIKLNDGIEKLSEKVSDTLFVITADHGQIDVGENIALYEDSELTALLKWPQYLEARATAFKIKDGSEDKFTTLFRKKYGEDFELFRTEDLIRQGYFGPNQEAEHASLLGDFIAVGKTDKIFRLSPFGHIFKGHHTSLTEEEMFVPLIYYGKNAKTIINTER